MVSEATNVLLAGIIAGFIVVVTQPLYKSLCDFLIKRWGWPKILVYIIVPIIWLLAMMVLVIKVYG